MTPNVFSPIVGRSGSHPWTPATTLFILGLCCFDKLICHLVGTGHSPCRKSSRFYEMNFAAGARVLVGAGWPYRPRCFRSQPEKASPDYRASSMVMSSTEPPQQGRTRSQAKEEVSSCSRKSEADGNVYSLARYCLATATVQPTCPRKACFDWAKQLRYSRVMTEFPRVSVIFTLHFRQSSGPSTDDMVWYIIRTARPCAALRSANSAPSVSGIYPRSPAKM